MLCQESLRHKVTSVDSGSLFIFWVLVVVCEIFPFQTLLRDAFSKVLKTAYTCYTCHPFVIKLKFCCFSGRNSWSSTLLPVLHQFWTEADRFCFISYCWHFTWSSKHVKKGKGNLNWKTGTFHRKRKVIYQLDYCLIQCRILKLEQRFSAESHLTGSTGESETMRASECFINKTDLSPSWFIITGTLFSL